MTPSVVLIEAIHRGRRYSLGPSPSLLRCAACAARKESASRRDPHGQRSASLQQAEATQFRVQRHAADAQRRRRTQTIVLVLTQRRRDALTLCLVLGLSKRPLREQLELRQQRSGNRS